MSNLVYKSKPFWKNPSPMITAVLTFAQMVMVVILLMMLLDSLLIKFLIILVVLYGLYYILKDEYIFKLYEDRVDFVNALREEKIIGSIPFTAITQVRYEDDFSKDYLVSSMDSFAKIYLYTADENEKTKGASESRTILNVTEWRNKEQALINILRVFKTHQIELFVSTKYKRLLKELELKNWTQP